MPKRLPKKWVKKLIEMPESGMGYQEVDIILKENHSFTAIILNCEWITEIIGNDDVTFLVKNIKDIKDAKTISKLLIERAADELPPVKEGYIRMFRGEGPHPGTTDDPTIGRWFAHNLQIASCFPLGKLGDSRLSYVDIPETSLAEYHVDNMPEFSGASKGGEYLLPPELVIQAREFIRFLKADTSGDPWSTSQSSNLISSKSM